MKKKQHRAVHSWRKRQKPKKISSGHHKPWDGVKTTWIALLLGMNVLLLAVLGVVYGYDTWLSAQTRAGMDSMLAQRGILCGSSVYQILETCPEAYTLRIDDGVQDAFTNALLTGAMDMEAKGNVTAWHGDNGTVEWSVSGEINAHVRLPEVIEPQNMEQAQDVVYDLLNQAGFSIRRDQIETIQNESGYVVTVWQEIHGIQLVGCSMQFTIAPENQFTIEGTWCIGTADPMTIRALENYSAEQMLLTFVQSQDSVTQIVSVQPVYVLSDRSGGRFTAIPCWQFATDNGEYILNILTGEVANMENLGVRGNDETDDSFQEELDSWEGSDESTDASWDDSGSGETADTSWDDEQEDANTEMTPDGEDAIVPQPEDNTQDLWRVEG